MSKNLPTIITAFVLLVVLVVYMVTYQVGFTDRVVVTTFGKPLERSDVVVEHAGMDRAAAAEVLVRTGMDAGRAGRILGGEAVVEDLAPDKARALGDQLEQAGATVRVRQTAGKPGWNFKWPWPVQKVLTYDGRVQILEDTEEETLTKDGKNIIIVTYCAWRVDDALKFSKAIRRLKQAPDTLLKLVRSAKTAVIGTYMLDDFVSLDRDALRDRYSEIEGEILRRSREVALAQYGVDVTSLGIRRISLPKNVSTKVFEQMSETRKKLAATARAEGTAEAARIAAQAENAKRTILAFAEALAAKIRSQGDAAAARYYETFRENPEFAQFLEEMEFLRQTLQKETTLVLDWQTPPFGYFQNDANVLKSILGTTNDASSAE